MVWLVWFSIFGLVALVCSGLIKIVFIFEVIFIFEGIFQFNGVFLFDVIFIFEIVFIFGIIFIFEVFFIFQVVYIFDVVFFNEDLSIYIWVTFIVVGRGSILASRRKQNRLRSRASAHFS